VNVTTYHADPAKIQGRLLGPIPTTLVMLSFPLITTLFRYFKGVDDAHGLTDYWVAAGDDIIQDFRMAIIMLIILLALDLLQAHPRLIARVHLRLDRDGLTQSGRFRTRRWPWRDLPAFTRFTHEANQTPPNIAFHLPGQDPDSLRKGEILDQYEAPLDEIAATLNEYRERALREARAAE